MLHWVFAVGALIKDIPEAASANSLESESKEVGHCPKNQRVTL
jgi:hypothetical protein